MTNSIDDLGQADDVLQAREQRHVRAVALLEPDVREVHEVDSPRITDDELGAVVLHRLLEEGAEHGVVPRRVRPDHEDDLGLENFLQAVGHRP